MAAEKAKEALVNREATEKKEKENTATYYSTGIENIKTKYQESVNANPTKAKELAKEQLRKLKTAFDTYKKSPNGEKLIAEYEKDRLTSNMEAIIIGKVDGFFKQIDIIEGSGTDKETLLRTINQITNEDSMGNILLGLFLTKQQSGEHAQKEIRDMHAKNDVIDFLNGRAYCLLPSFDENARKILEEGLSRPGAILKIYEGLGENDIGKILKRDPDFIKKTNDALIQQYPIFKEIQGKEWYKNNLTFDKITTILDIIKYRPKERQADFMKMMSEPGEDAIQIYEKFFTGTEIGNSIHSYFKDSPFILYLRKRTRESIDATTKKTCTNTPESGIVCKNIDVKSKGISEYIETHLSKIPQKLLKPLLGKLPAIEKMCEANNMEAIIKMVDEIRVDGTEIDVYYKSLFFDSIAEIASIFDTDIKERTKKFYHEVANNFSETKLNVSKERDAILKDTTETKEKITQFSIIEKLFPGDTEKEKEVREQKNKDFRAFLMNNRKINNGKIVVSKKDFLDELKNIFQGTKESEAFFEKINKSPDGRVMMQLLAEGFADEKKQLKTNLNKQGFDETKWNAFRDKDVDGSNKLLEKLKDKETNTEEKIKLLERFIDTSKIPGKEKQKEREKFIEDIINTLGGLTVATKSQERYTDPKNAADFAESWKSGSFETFNQKTQEREEKKEQELIKKQEIQKQQSQNNQITSAAALDFQAFNTAFNKISNDRIIKTFIDGQEVYVKKDSENEISLFSGGVPIRNIKITDEKNPEADIRKAMNSVQFIKDCGLSIFGTSLPKMIDIINNKQKGKGERKINLADGLDGGGEEERIFLQYIAKMVDIDAALSIDNLRREFSDITKNEGMLSRLRTKKPEYVTNDSLNMTTILNDLEKAGV